MGKVTPDRKKLLRSFLKRRSEKSQTESTRIKQYEEAQNRIMLSKFKLARKKAMRAQRQQEQTLANLIDQEIVKAMTPTAVSHDINQPLVIKKLNDNT